MKYFYADSCFLISLYQDNRLKFLKKFRQQFFISNSQINAELIYPSDLSKLVRECLTVINENEAIRKKGNELQSTYKGLSKYDCLGLAFAIIEHFCLVTNDIKLSKVAQSLGVSVKNLDDIVKEFKLPTMIN